MNQIVFKHHLLFVALFLLMSFVYFLKSLFVIFKMIQYCLNYFVQSVTSLLPLQTSLSELEHQQSLTNQEMEALKNKLKVSEESKLQVNSKLLKLQKEDQTKVLQDKVYSLEKQKSDLDRRLKELDRERNDLNAKMRPLEKEKTNLSQKIRELEECKSDMNKKLKELEINANGKQKELQQEMKGIKREKEEVCKTIKVIEKDLRKVAKDVANPKKVQNQIKKLVEGIEMNTLIPKSDEELNALKDLDQLAQELSDKASEAETWKNNFEKLQNDFSDRTNELEVFNSKLQKAKSDGSNAVEKLKKAEEDLSQIKEKNAQLSDELLSKSRQLTALENQTKDSKAMEEKRVDELQKTIEDLQKKLDNAYEHKRPLMERKKSVKFALEPTTVISPSDLTEKDNKIQELEKALDDAARERQEILEAAESEIEYHRSIACELEQTMIEDFEWKIHEIESDYHRRLKDATGTDLGKIL